MDKTSGPELRQKLNQETARVHWSELERHYARGVLVKVDATLDLVEVAANMAVDDAAQVQDWLEQGLIQRVAVEDAKRWEELGTELWAVVVAPWVLVQEVADRDCAGLQ